jgi:hypothetical protein
MEGANARGGVRYGYNGRSSGGREGGIQIILQVHCWFST